MALSDKTIYTASAHWHDAGDCERIVPTRQPIANRCGAETQIAKITPETRT